MPPRVGSVGWPPAAMRPAGLEFLGTQDGYDEVGEAGDGNDRDDEIGHEGGRSVLAEAGRL